MSLVYLAVCFCL